MQVSTTLTFTRGSPVGLQGKNSEVFFAHDPQLDAELVVKRVPKMSIPDPAAYFSEASRLYDARHPNVVDVKYACADADSIYLAMPKYAGSVHALLMKRAVTTRDVLKIALDFLAGLHHVHTKKLIHFDVKPSNVLLDHAGRAALADFGLARPVDQHGLASVEKMYSKHIPPEWVTTSPELTITADVYQAGLTLYRMVNGLARLEAQRQKIGADIKNAITTGRYPDRTSFAPHVPKKLRKIIQRALSVNPDDRYQTVMELANEIAAVDQLLDWREAPLGKNLGWEHDDGTYVRRVELVPAQSGMFDLRVTRTRIDTQKLSVLHQHAKSGVSANKVASAVYDTLRVV